MQKQYYGEIIHRGVETVSITASSKEEALHKLKNGQYETIDCTGTEKARRIIPASKVETE